MKNKLKRKMYNYYDKRNNEECQCPCHLNNPCINEDYYNKSEILSDINFQNPNSELFSSNCNNKNPLFSPNEIYDYKYSPNWNNECHIRKMRLRERAQSLKDTINSKSFIKCLNNSKKKNIWSNSINNNYENLHAHQPSNKILNHSKSYLKNQLKNINNENKYLNELLSKVPRHEKNPYSSKFYKSKFKYSFTSSKLERKPNNMKSFMNTKKFKGYSSMIMPPNDLDTATIKSNVYT